MDQGIPQTGRKGAGSGCHIRVGKKTKQARALQQGPLACNDEGDEDDLRDQEEATGSLLRHPHAECATRETARRETAIAKGGPFG